MADNVFDLVRNTPGRQMDAADEMSKGAAPAPQAAPAQPSPKPIVRSPSNPDNSLPDTEGVFHKVVRRFKGDPVGTKEW